MLHPRTGLSQKCNMLLLCLLLLVIVIAGLKAAKGLGSLVCRSTTIFTRIVLTGQDLLHLLLCLLELLLEGIRNFGIGKAKGEDGLHELSLGKVIRRPDPAPVRPGVGLELDAGIDGVVHDDLHGLLLAHQDADAGMLPVLEDAGLADATLAPRLVAGALVEESLAEDEALGPDVVKALLILLTGLGLYLLELDLRICGYERRMQRLWVRVGNVLAQRWVVGTYASLDLCGGQPHARHK